MTAVSASLREWLNTGLGLIYPNVCQFCAAGRATEREGYVCSECWTQVRFIRPPFCERCGLPFQGDLTTKFECSNCRELELFFTSARSAVVAKSLVLEAIHRFKYSRALWFENFLADLLIREAGPALRGQAWDALVPVPLHPKKFREREYNQAEILARRLGAATNIPVDAKILQRIVPTVTQTFLTREQRATNMTNAFACAVKTLSGKRFVVVDDVFTTGATTSACAKALCRAGAAEVAVWTVARGL
jgi:competence protein ComFC